MHYYSVFKDRPVSGANGNVTVCSPACQFCVARRDALYPQRGVIRPLADSSGRIILEGPRVSADSTVKEQSARTWRVTQVPCAKYSENIFSSLKNSTPAR